MLKRILDYHSGRAIALCRLALALVFLLVLYADPDQPVRNPAEGYLFLGGYAVLSLALLAAIWDSWWRDVTLRIPALLLDCAVFLIAIYLTESSSTDFTSPFLSSFIFIILTATVRWGWSGMAIIAGLLSASYLAVGVWLDWAGFDVELYRFGRRGTYMILLSLILVWFGLQRRVRAAARLDLASESSDVIPVAEIADYAMKATGSPCLYMGWWSNEDPYVLLSEVPGTVPVIRHLPPDALAVPADLPFALFDRERRRLLVSTAEGRVTARREALTTPLLDYFAIAEGLMIPIRSSSGQGVLILSGNPGISIDDLAKAPAIAQEIAAALDRLLLSHISREAAVAQLRTTLARDLHDSVAQTLAGVRFRIEALRAQVRSGGDAEAQFDEMKASLSAEHRHLREMIERLRRTDLEPAAVSLAAQMQRVAGELERNWHAEVRVATAPADLAVPVALAYEIQQIAREAVANGVRHGKAKRFTIGISRGAAGIDLDIRDDGTGFTGTPPPHPRTLEERARANGGRLAVCACETGAHLMINLPERSEA
ncbi:MAG: histidine kinase [Erythrobacter sp.]|uniref:sensor histidine kinase n=1 Tax=Erythrobacter sp. TaxID=1042 RepID=UPI0025F416E6|nr:histidine kinase [Erythrobacter sp.]MCM0000707.1 histidine kinase [Erythrobacter sp.]